MEGDCENYHNPLNGRLRLSYNLLQAKGLPAAASVPAAGKVQHASAAFAQAPLLSCVMQAPVSRRPGTWWNNGRQK
jgi:hypothetical protein